MLKRILIGIVLLFAALAAIVATLNFRGEDRMPDAPAAFSPTPEQVKRGEYLARVGNCIGCHTVRGGAPYAGGRGVRTPFGTLYSTNITPDAKTGLGGWTPAHFWRAMHNGRSKDGRLLYPAFPYPDYTLLTREDSDAIFAFLASLPPVEQRREPHRLSFPFNSQVALAVWRALFFAPGEFRADNAKSADWNRGAYLVQGLGHCAACHSVRNIFGATTDNLELSGGLIPMQDWYAPSLHSRHEAGVGEWDIHEIVDLLKNGVSPQGSVLGPMAEVVFHSTQYVSNDDLRAIAVFLKSLPPAAEKFGEEPWYARFIGGRKKHTLAADVQERGAKIYGERCADCHGERGEGVLGAYPALAGNRAVTMDVPFNVIRVVLSGGYPPATAGNPRPYGMPPFSHVLDDAQIATVISYIRGAWGNGAEPVSQVQVMQLRRGRSE